MERLNEEQQELAASGMSLADSIARRYKKLCPTYEQDIDSAANYGALRAAATYVPEMKGIWERWCGLCVHGEIKNFFTSPYQKRRKLSDDMDDDMERISYEEYRNSKQAREYMMYEKAMNLLPEKHRQLCELVYQEGMTAGRAGIELGYTSNHGDKLHREAIAILREHLAA